MTSDTTKDPYTADVDRRSRILGCFLGGAVGDAAGKPIVFVSRSQIRKTIGPRGVDGYWDRAARLYLASRVGGQTLSFQQRGSPCS